MMSCKDIREEMTAHVLKIGDEHDVVPAPTQRHLSSCEPCRSDAAAMSSLKQVLDEWSAPEPNAYFMTRFEARLEEERTAAPRGWLARQWSDLRARIVYGTRWGVQPVAATALSVLVMVGGGVYLTYVQPGHQPAPAVITVTPAVIQDLQNLDTNATALDTLESLSGSHD